MIDLSRILVMVGGFLAAVGVIIYGIGRAGFNGLPGDLSYRRPGLQIFFPIVSCLAASALLTLGLWLFRWLARR